MALSHWDTDGESSPLSGGFSSLWRVILSPEDSPFPGNAPLSGGFSSIWKVLPVLGDSPLFPGAFPLKPAPIVESTGETIIKLTLRSKVELRHSVLMRIGPWCTGALKQSRIPSGGYYRLYSGAHSRVHCRVAHRVRIRVYCNVRSSAQLCQGSQSALWSNGGIG